MKKINFIFTSILISFALTVALGFIPAKNNTALALMIELGIEDLTKEADLILKGKVVDIKSEWNEDKTKIYTYITLNVNERIKGRPQRRIVTIRQLGGEVDGIGLVVSDSAVFKKGEDAIVFLKPDRTHHAGRLRRAGRGVINEIVGKEQGKYAVAEDGVTRRKMVTVGRGKFATRNGRIVPRIGRKVLLEDFIGQIKSIKEERQ